MGFGMLLCLGGGLGFIGFSVFGWLLSCWGGLLGFGVLELWGLRVVGVYGFGVVLFTSFGCRVWCF